MAALCVGNGVLLLTNGKTAAIAQFRSPEKIQQLDVPVVELPNAKKDAAQKPGKKQKKASDERPEEENYILACSISRDGSYVALCDDRKFLHIYKVEGDRCSLQFSSLVARRCTAVRFSHDNTQVVVADKAGDAYSFDVREQIRIRGQGQGDSDQGHETRKDDLDTSVDTEGDGCVQESTAADEEEDEDERGCVGRTLVLGHLSMLLDMLLVAKDRFIVTCDRDEKIRISHYPDAYDIHAYCLGHTEFVISLAYDEENKWLISGSGDATIRLWNLDGQELCQRKVLQDLPDNETVPEAEKGNGIKPDVPETTVLPEAEQGDAARNRLASSQAVQQIAYCAACHVLCVSMYRCPHILIYKLAGAESEENPSFHPLNKLSVEGTVVSLCLHQCVLWVLRQGESKLELSAYKIQLQGDAVKVSAVDKESSTESKLLDTLCSQSDLLSTPPSSMDLFPFLWKSRFQEDFRHLGNMKRQIESEEGSKRHGKKKRKQR